MFYIGLELGTSLLEKEYWIRMFEYRELRKIFGLMGRNVTMGEGGTAQRNKFHKHTETLCSPFVTGDSFQLA